MTEHRGDSGWDAVDVHNRLDKVVLVVTERDGGSARATLTAQDAREVAERLREAANSAERTPGSSNVPRGRR